MRDLKEHKRLCVFVRDHAGEIDVSEFVGWDHAESSVWRIESSGGSFILKSHRQPRKFDQELAAYENWLPYLAPSVPELVAVRKTEPRALLVTCLAGEVVERLKLNEHQECVLLSKGGQVSCSPACSSA